MSYWICSLESDDFREVSSSSALLFLPSDKQL